MTLGKTEYKDVPHEEVEATEIPGNSVIAASETLLRPCGGVKKTVSLHVYVYRGHARRMGQAVNDRAQGGG